MLLDYETLRLIWWVLLGVLLIGFAATDGFDLGVAALLPFAAKGDTERRIAINTVGPVWEGNQVWLVLGGGAIFAAWPQLYAISFSGFYLAMFVTLVALILRPVAFKFRSKREDPKWRQRWDIALFIGGFVPALIFGVAIGNVLQGVPFHLDDTLRPFYTGTFFGLLNPFGLLCGLTSVALLLMHGGVWLAFKADGPVGERGRLYGMIMAVATIVLFALGGVAIAMFIDGFNYVNAVDTNGPSNPLINPVERVEGGWLANYAAYPWLMAAPIMGFAGAALTLLALLIRKAGPALITSFVSIFGVISTVGVSMFPMILPSSTMPNASLGVWDSSSSHLTLFIMLIVTVIFLPIVLAYTAWAYKILWGKVTAEYVNDSQGPAY